MPKKKNPQPLFQFTTKSILDRRFHRVEICSVFELRTNLAAPFFPFLPNLNPRVSSSLFPPTSPISLSALGFRNLVWQRAPAESARPLLFSIGRNAFAADGAIILFSTFSGRLIGVLDGLMGALLNYDDCEIKVREICRRYDKNRTSTNRGNLIFLSFFFFSKEILGKGNCDYFWNRYLEIEYRIYVFGCGLAKLLTRIIIQSCNYTVERTNQLLLIRGILTRNVWLLLSVNTENFEVVLFSISNIIWTYYEMIFSNFFASLSYFVILCIIYFLSIFFLLYSHQHR